MSYVSELEQQKKKKKTVSQHCVDFNKVYKKLRVIPYLIRCEDVEAMGPMGIVDFSK